MQQCSIKCVFKVAYTIQRVNGYHVGDTLMQFVNDFGAPDHLTFDEAAVRSGPQVRFIQAIRNYPIKYHVSGPRRPSKNPAKKNTQGEETVVGTAKAMGLWLQLGLQH